jgi:ribosomal protein L14
MQEDTMRISQFLHTSAAAAAILSGASLFPLAVSAPATAGDKPVLSNVVPQSMAMTLHAKIAAINPGTRQVTLVGRSGTPVTLVAGPAVRLEMLKVGDIVNATYYRSVAFVVSQPGEPVPADQMDMAITRPAEAPGGTAISVSRISGVVVGIDLGAHRVDLVSPGGGPVYTVEVIDPARQARLPLLKVGDTITAVVSQTLAVAIQPAPKSVF